MLAAGTGNLKKSVVSRVKIRGWLYSDDLQAVFVQYFLSISTK